MKKLLVKILAACLALTTGAAHAGFGCTGVITNVGTGTIAGVGNAGDVWVRIGTGNIHSICNITTQGSFTIPPAACAEHFKKLELAQIAQQPITLYYNSFSCTTFPDWGSVPSYYFILS